MIIRVRVLVNLTWYSSYCHARFSVIFTPTPKHSCVQPLPQYFSARNLGALKGPGIGYLKKTPQCHGAFHSTKILVWKFKNSTCPMERFIPVSQIRSKPQGVCLLFLLQAGYKRAVLGTTILSNGRLFCRTDRNEWTGQSEPPSKVVPNIPVGPNRNTGNGSFHLISNQKLRIFELNGKCPRKIGRNKFMMYEKWHQISCVTVEIERSH